MFLEAIQKPDVEIERLDGADYYRVVHQFGATVISGIVRGVTFSFEVPGDLGQDEVRSLIAHVTKGVEENVFLGSDTLV